MRANGIGDEEGILLIGLDYDMGEESVSASRQPVAADKGATAQCSVAGGASKVAADIDEEGDDDDIEEDDDEQVDG